MLVPPKIMKLAAVADAENSRYALSGIKFERDSAGVPYAVATDGWRLVRVTWEEDDPQDYPVTSGLCASRVPGFETILGAKDCAEAAKLPPRRTTKPILGNVVIDEASANGKVTYGATDLERTRKVEAVAIEGKFPRWRDVMVVPSRILKAPDPRTQAEPVTLSGGDYVQVRINPRLMVDLLMLAHALVCDEESQGVTLQVPLGHGPVMLVDQHNGVDYVGAIMPLSSAD